MTLAIEIIAIVLMFAGFFFFVATAVGILRFPDFYCRMHAAGKGDTLSTMLMMMGLALYHLEHFSVDTVLVSLKIMFIAVFIFLSSPTASHAIINAGYKYGEPLWKNEKNDTDKSSTTDGEDKA